MRTLIAKAIEYSRTVWLFLILIIIAGVSSYSNISKESSPDIPIPRVYVSVHYDGISPEDAVSLLLKPLETELKSISGLDELQSQAYQGGASLTLKFNAGFDSEKAISDVREAVDTAKSDLPDDADEPKVREINTATFPVVSVVLLGNAPERKMAQVADDLQDIIEAIPTVLEANIKGERETQALVEIDNAKLESYKINPSKVISAISNNNKLVTAGTLETTSSAYSIKVPGLFKSREDVLNLPLLAQGDKIIKIGDIADVKLVFKDPTTISRFNGESAMIIEVSKRIGENVIQTVDLLKQALEDNKEIFPNSITYKIINDDSQDIKDMLSDLQNNVFTSVLLVMIIILAILGVSSSSLVALSIPGSFLLAISSLYFLGFTINNMVLFAFILSVGMLVDGAIVVVEMADNLMEKGYSRVDAYKKAAINMVWPIAASTATTLSAFLPLLFWPGTVGEFMKFLPITLIFTLTSSLIMAVVFIPVIGSKIARKNKHSHNEFEDKVKNKYSKVLVYCIEKPKRILALAVAIFISIFVVYFFLNHGTEFFPKSEPESANILVHAKGDWSVYEKDEILKKVEQVALKQEGIKNIYTVAGSVGSSTGGSQDIVGKITLAYDDWDTGRPKSAEILNNIKKNTEHLYGIVVEGQESQGGPRSGKPINIALKGDNYDLLKTIAQKLAKELEVTDGIKDLTTSLSDSGIEWNLKIDREEASRNNTNLIEVGNTASLATSGVKVGKYRPIDSNDEYDIVARFKESQRSLTSIDNLRVITSTGDVVPAENLMQRYAQQKVNTIERLNQKNVIYVKADVKDGYLASNIVAGIKQELAKQVIPDGVFVEFKGDQADQNQSSSFLEKAFVIAIMMMLIILVTQFNSLFQAFVILSAVVLSVAGVLVGHLIMLKPFSVVMSGIGVIALAGIVVNNNIVLIDAYNQCKKDGLAWKDALIEACRSRLRPVLLTAITTLIGLMPMALKLTVSFTDRKVMYDSPSSQWWDQLASSIAFGLTFATVLTLLVTPSLISWYETRQDNKIKNKIDKVL
jgi:multidrug efflux pump